MYPPVLVLVLALVSISRQTSSLETLLQLDTADDDRESDFSSPYASGGLLGYGDVDTAAEEDVASQQPGALPDSIYYRMTPGEVEYSEETLTGAVSAQQNASEQAGEDTVGTTDNYVTASVASSTSASASSLASSEGKAASVAEAFVADDDDGTLLNSRALDHEAADSLHSSTVLETTNFLYSGVTNDSAEQSQQPGSFESGEEDAQALATTTNIPPLGGPDVDGDILMVVKPTKPHIDESKISKPELLARFITDKNLRMPIAFLVDSSNDSLAYTKRVLEASLIPKSPLEVILMRYNSTGISKSVAFRNTKSLMDAVNTLQPSYEQGGSAYYGILRTSQEIPYDSAIFLATSSTASDKELSRMTALTLLKKRIRLYIVWFGEEPDTNQRLDNQAGLHELAYKTGGRVIHFEVDRYFGNNPVLTTLVEEQELRGTQTIPIAVGEDVNALYFKLRGSLEQATLETPNGSIVDLLHRNNDNGGGIGTGTDASAEDPTGRAALEQGRGRTYQPAGDQAERDYRVVVDASTPGQYRLNVSTSLSSLSSAGARVTVKSGRRSRFGSATTFEQPADSLAKRQLDDVEPTGNELYDSRPQVGSSKHAREATEHRFARQTEFGDEESGVSGRASIQSVTKVDVGVNSQLIGTRGQTLQLYFEVTNYRQTSIVYYFKVVDELSFLRALNPQQATLAPGQTVNVVVTLTIGPSAEIGSKDKVTFSTEGSDHVVQAAWVTVSDSTGLADTTRPSIWYTYSSRCEGRSTPATCTGAFWTLEVTARDYETGLMRISSNPPGIIYKTPFTAGTRDEVQASYTASCCQPRVTIAAYDISKNVRSVNLDVTDVWLNDAGIAAVVLGVLLFIALIVLLVLLIRYCVRKRKQSQDLPTYRGGGEPFGATRRTK